MRNGVARSPLWPCELDHFQLNSQNPKALAEFYRDAMGMEPQRLRRDLWLVEGRDRRLLIGKGENGEQPFAAMALGTPQQLGKLRRFLAQQSVRTLEPRTPLFRRGAFAVRDYDGREMIFGLPFARKPGRKSRDTNRASKLSARLQHIVVATAALDDLSHFYQDQLGFGLSDTVFNGPTAGEGEVPVVKFFRAGREHHSFAVFQAPSARHDHHCYETRSWNDIRDWLDFFADIGVTPWWGPGRHGPGNNLFFMVKDPDGNNIELSAELQKLPKPAEGGRWPMAPATLNRWGVGWNRLEG